MPEPGHDAGAAMTALLLVGAGHTHLYLVKHAAELAAAGYRVQLLAPRFFDYSGVASARAAGALSGDAGRIDVRALAAGCGVDFHEATVESLDADARIAVTSDGARLPYDVLSINIGSVVAPEGMEVHPGVLRVKPLSGLGDLDVRLRALGQRGAAVTVVGGGASGLELAAHLAVRPDVAQVRLVESGPFLGADLPAGARTRISRLLTKRDVVVHTGCVVSEIGERQLVCQDGTQMAHDVAVLATGLAAPPLLAALGLGDGHGVPVRATLQHVDRDEIYAVGDCAHFLPRPLPRLGVHGVRQGPVLHRSLLARVRAEPLPVYEPQRRALSILDLGGAVGLAVRGRVWWYGTGPLHLKRYIDRRWLRTYQPEPGPWQRPTG
ncbi:NAD(P)/FAD-dependent oxidoreductase [Serinibacter salmoneus]|uniref:NADH dehydrogenase FAD-containing subunit n=1 Tax=Serinibacter salmoneus TaxID=556530 RepID=A0A2A9CZD3_9MICO|nr:FAD-dependent oxidoreductase [Serinibacter salmoneus]PFG19486.1 NADH dehydrogenase FAD-containing subunit [Serinibacter salmoneus]